MLCVWAQARFTAFSHCWLIGTGLQAGGDCLMLSMQIKQHGCFVFRELNPQTPSLLPVALKHRHAPVPAFVHIVLSTAGGELCRVGRTWCSWCSYQAFFFFPLGKGWEENAFAVGAEFICNNLRVFRWRSDTSAVMRNCVPSLQLCKVKPKP